MLAHRADAGAVLVQRPVLIPSHCLGVRHAAQHSIMLMPVPVFPTLGYSTSVRPSTAGPESFPPGRLPTPPSSRQA